MTISAEVLAHVAKLARISLTSDEAERYRAQLVDVLHAMEELNAVDTKALAPASPPAVLLSTTRADIPETRHHAPAIIDQAPDHTGRYVRVKGGIFTP